MNNPIFHFHCKACGLTALIEIEQQPLNEDKTGPEPMRADQGWMCPNCCDCTQVEVRQV